MKSMWRAYRTQGVYLSALIILLSFSLATLVSCSQPTPAYVSLNLGIPAAALQSPVKDPLPDSTVLHVGITFKIDPKVLAEAGQQPLQPGQNSNLEALAKRLGIDDATYQKIKQFFSPQGIILRLSKLRTHLSIVAKAGTLAKVLQTKFVIHQYNGRTFYAPATPPKSLPPLPLLSIQSRAWIITASLPCLRCISALLKHHASHGKEPTAPPMTRRFFCHPMSPLPMATMPFTSAGCMARR